MMETEAWQGVLAINVRTFWEKPAGRWDTCEDDTHAQSQLASDV